MSARPMEVDEGVENAGRRVQRTPGERAALNFPAGMSVQSLRLKTRVAARPESSGAATQRAGEPSPSPTRTSYSDRFIPSRSSSNLANYGLLDNFFSGAGGTNSAHEGEGREDGAGAYSQLLRSELFGSEGGPLSPSTPEKALPLSARDASSSPGNLFRFKTDHRAAGGVNSRQRSLLFQSPNAADDAFTGVATSPRKAPRKIARSPYKVLDAPALQDDFYLNLVDWSSHNVLAVGLGTCVYLWSASTSKVTKLCDFSPSDVVCSVAWTQRGTYLAVGTNGGEVQIWDATRCKKVRMMRGHSTRVGTLAWSSSILSSGSRDRHILQRDVRVQDDFVSKLLAHKSEVCGLKWSYDDRELASGGNDNQLFVWNQQSTQPFLKFSEHTAAVKAITWSPHQHGLLASGGGTADRCIRFWNTATSTALNCYDTGSQVCNLVWSKNANELVSTHGYSQNQIIVWRYPSMSKLATLTGHTMRVLYLAISPDGQTIVTGAGDETLRFWNVFPSPKSQSTVRDTGVWSLGHTHIR